MKFNEDVLNKNRSNYILKGIYENLNIKNSLELIKYNKKLQKRLNIKLNDYKIYREAYSPIEIEIIPIQGNFGKYINYNKHSNYDSYIHIYFNDSKIEEKRNYLCEKDKISKIKIVIDYQLKSFCYLFQGCKCIEEIHFIKFYRNNITNMRSMFYGCSSLKEIDFSNFITNNVTDMSFMFYECSSLKELNPSNFNTNNVTEMTCMFGECSSLKKLNLSNFNVNNETNTCYMFCGCSSLTELNLSNFNFNNVFNKSKMFLRCSS